MLTKNIRLPRINEDNKVYSVLFYDYYSEGPRQSIKYFATLGAMTLLFYLNLFTLLILFKLDFLVPSRSGNRFFDFLNMSLFLLPVFLAFRFLIKQQELENADYDGDKVSSGKFWLVFYIIASIITLTVVIIIKK
jgi:hypothetical protein